MTAGADSPVSLPLHGPKRGRIDALYDMFAGETVRLSYDKTAAGTHPLTDEHGNELVLSHTRNDSC